MTTTPWDREIAATEQERQAATSQVYRAVLLDKLYKLEGRAEGYRQAKTEDAALLEACQLIVAVADCMSFHRVHADWLVQEILAKHDLTGDNLPHQVQLLAQTAQDKARAAIAQHEGREQPASQHP